MEEAVWKVLIFLAPLCPICQNMTFDLRQIEEDFADEPVEFVGVFPNESTTQEQIDAFQATYGLSMSLCLDTLAPRSLQRNPRTNLIQQENPSNAPARPDAVRRADPPCERRNFAETWRSKF